jgi:hypothetical protein
MINMGRLYPLLLVGVLDEAVGIVVLDDMDFVRRVSLSDGV